MPKKEDKGRKKLVVEEVETPVSNEVVSSTEMEKDEVHSAENVSRGEVTEEAAHDEATEETKKVEEPSVEMEKEIHEEEKHLHDIHTGVTQTEDTQRKEGNPVWWILIPGIFLLGALLGGIFFYQKGVNKGETATPVPSASPVVVATPSPSPIAKADLSKYPIRVENGSGVPGGAGAVKDILTKAGFKVSSTGNADNYDYTDTIIEAKSDVPSGFISQLSDSLKATYSIGKNVVLKDSSTDEVIVIVGSSKAK